jgi:hypothetical protein
MLSLRSVGWFSCVCRDVALPTTTTSSWTRRRLLSSRLWPESVRSFLSSCDQISLRLRWPGFFPFAGCCMADMFPSFYVPSYICAYFPFLAPVSSSYRLPPRAFFLAYPFSFSPVPSSAPGPSRVLQEEREPLVERSSRSPSPRPRRTTTSSRPPSRSSTSPPSRASRRSTCSGRTEPSSTSRLLRVSFEWSGRFGLAGVKS